MFFYLLFISKEVRSSMTLMFLSLFVILFLSICFFVLKSFENYFTVYLWFPSFWRTTYHFWFIFICFFIVTEFRTTLPLFDFIHQFFFCNFQMFFKKSPKQQLFFLFYLAFITCLLRHQRKHYTCFRRTTLSYGYQRSASKPCLLFSRTGT